MDDDFLIQNGQYAIYFHKKDILQALNDIDKKLKTNNSNIIKDISDGTLKQIDLLSKLPSDKPIIRLVNSSLGCYLLLKAKATVYKDNSQLEQISKEEAPPEAELDGTMSNIFFFTEIGTGKQIFHGSIRTELRQEKNN
jgi:hypothetical protein